MTTQTTTIRTNNHGVRVLIGAATASLALLGGALLWQAWPANEPTTPVAATTMSRASESVLPMGGLTELYRDQQAAVQAEAALQERMGGIAELYRDQALARRTTAAGAQGAMRDGCGHDAQTRAC